MKVLSGESEAFPYAKMMPYSVSFSPRLLLFAGSFLNVVKIQ